VWRIPGIRSDSAQVMVRGIVARTVVLALTFFVPLMVVTVSVTWTVTELGPAISLLFGTPESTPADESFSPLGKETFFHLSVVS
jgi:hypothetical protein